MTVGFGIMTARGNIAWHSSDDDGGPDVGISVGLGDGRMLYAGDVSGQLGPWSLCIYTTDGRIDIGGPVDPEAARDMIEAIAATIRTAEADTVQPPPRGTYVQRGLTVGPATVAHIFGEVQG